MGFRFRKSIKIIPGLKLNLGKRGASLSVGGRGATLTFGSSGTRITAGIPGTGISYSEKIGSSSKKQSAQTFSSVPQEIKTSLTVSDDGNIDLLDDNGKSLPPKIKKLALEQSKEKIRVFLEQKAEEWNKEINEILNIHLKTPSPEREIVFIPKPFDIPKPVPPDQKQAGFFGKFIKSKQESIQRENETALQKHKNELAKWDEVRNKYETSENNRRWLIEMGRYSDPEKMQEFLEYIFGEIEFPRETLLSFQVESDGKAVMIDVDLPEIEDLPAEQAAIAKNGMKLNFRNRSESQIRKDYMNHIHGIAFRIIGQTYVALPTIEKIVCSGYSQRPNKATGQINDEYLFSVRVTREEWKKINFGNLKEIDLPACLGSFDIRRKMTKTGVFTPITPFDSIN